ncbi:MAG: G5 domain-containing protein [Oscillibacter sp.]|nr:G5 domain-containing protein [Oscillibacter sp.]
MKKHFLLKQLHAFWKRYSVSAFIAAAVACVCLLTVGNADALYILTGADDSSAIVLDDTADKEAVRDLSSQLVYVDSGNDGYEVTLKAGQTVTIHSGGAQVTALAGSETVSELLNRVNIHPEATDVILVDLSGTGATLVVASDLTFYDEAVESVPFKTIRKATSELPQGTQKVLQAGKNGTRAATYKVTYADGKLVSREFVKQSDCTTVDEIVAVGTSVSSVTSGDRISNISKNADGGGVLTFRSGATMKFSSAKSMTATAYTSGSGGADGRTATGTAVHVGTVAVDRNVIPLGTRMYIVTNDGQYVYGMAAAEDTGVRGKVVDLYYDSYSQCIRFGRRACTVYILGK